MTRFGYGRLVGIDSDGVANLILEQLRVSPNGLSRTDIGRLFSRNVSADVLRAALRTLRDSGRADYELWGSGGRPLELWHATSAALSSRDDGFDRLRARNVVNAVEVLLAYGVLVAGGAGYTLTEEGQWRAADAQLRVTRNAFVRRQGKVS